MKELFRNKNFTLLFLGNFVSELGNVLFGFVAGLYVQDLAIKSGGEILGVPSGMMLGTFMALGAIIRVALTPIAGVLVDRWNKVKIIYLTDYLRGIMFVVVGYVFFIGVPNDTAMIILLGITVISGVVSAFFGPAISSITPEIVGLEKVQTAQGANSIIQSSTMIVGVLLGAAAYGLFDFHTALLLNGLSFIISGFSEMFIKALYKEDVIIDKHESVLAGFKIGLSYLRTKTGLLTMMVFSLFLNFAFSPLFSVGIPYFFRTELTRSEWDIAWVNITFGVSMMISGVVVGSMVFRSIKKVIRQNLVLLSSSFIFMTIIITLLTQSLINYPIFYILMIIGNIGMATFMMATNVPLNTALIKAIDQEYRGRVFGVISSISGGAVPIAIFLGGVIVSYTSVSVLAMVCSVLLLVPTIGFITNDKITHLFDSLDQGHNHVELIQD
ncbi:MFS transporter [Candidatus Xianfuyuplasma coldseepsis]|uniref:MFS transporter n=1 Tax=Candidatus Xianfuyuplasma coldseepsis TaxID=2782163 RepID=A0A7L7KRF5_9MOLU|nr:MFS transporter [Xianfuyuplasma coldseepsis]QMS85287.1 MFS transporter [Xianfuyuplasma coldseepsis]